MATPTATSLRGLTIQYFFYRDGWFNGPEGDYSKNEDIYDEGETPEGSSFVNGCFANVQWTYDCEVGPEVEMLCMTYNPITDHYAIKEGEYVL